MCLFAAHEGIHNVIHVFNEWQFKGIFRWDLVLIHLQVTTRSDVYDSLFVSHTGSENPLTYPEILELGSLDWIRDTSVERWGQGFTNLNFIGIRYKLLRTYKWEFRGNMSSLHQINIGTLSLKKG